MPRVTITVPGSSPQPYRFQLDQKSVIIGRAHENDIPVDSASVSSRHAEMKRAKGGYELHDLGSTNGIKINGSLVSHVALRDGMSVELGEVLLGFELSPEERAILDMQASVDLKTEPAEKSATTTPPQGFGPPKAPVAQQAQRSAHRSDSGISVMFLLVLALIGFCFGMALRFKSDTGHSWLETVLKKYAASDVSVPAGKQQL
jgi:pSer/pThr/pTyr-binding forkhead associated (FHA) protein